MDVRHNAKPQSEVNHLVCNFVSVVYIKCHAHRFHRAGAIVERTFVYVGHVGTLSSSWLPEM